MKWLISKEVVKYVCKTENVPCDKFCRVNSMHSPRYPNPEKYSKSQLYNAGDLPFSVAICSLGFNIYIFSLKLKPAKCDIPNNSNINDVKMTVLL